MRSGYLRHSLLDDLAIEHGFGTRDSVVPGELVRPKQVHGAEVVRSTAQHAGDQREADAIATRVTDRSVGVLTADCVPILVAAHDGRGVAAIHAGWRGLAAGVVEAGVAALRELCEPEARLVAAIGPRIGVCCYEVDRPVLDAMTQRFTNAEIERACVETRPGHARVDLAALCQLALQHSGIAPADHAALDEACTACDAERFHSYRRDAEAAGRLAHFITSR